SVARLFFCDSRRACRATDPVPPGPYSICVGRPTFIDSSGRRIGVEEIFATSARSRSLVHCTCGAIPACCRLAELRGGQWSAGVLSYVTTQAERSSSEIGKGTVQEVSDIRNFDASDISLVP